MARPPRTPKQISAPNAQERIAACRSPRAAMRQVLDEMRRGTLAVTGIATFSYDEVRENKVVERAAYQKAPIPLVRGWWTRINADHQLKDFWKLGAVRLTRTEKEAKAEITGIMLDAKRLDELLAPYAILPPTPPSGKSRKGRNAYRHGEPVTYVAQYLRALPKTQQNKMTAMRLGDILGKTYLALGYDAPNVRNLDGIAAGILHAHRNPQDLPKMIQDWENFRQTEALQNK